jgi:hypothetical protein
MQAQLDQHLPAFAWTKVQHQPYCSRPDPRDATWEGTPRFPHQWPPNTKAQVRVMHYTHHQPETVNYSLTLEASKASQVHVHELGEDLGKLVGQVASHFRRDHAAVVGHLKRLKDQAPPPKGARWFHKDEVQPGDVLLPMPGKELFVSPFDARRQEVVSYRLGQASGWTFSGVPGEHVRDQRVVVDRTTTKAIFVRVQGRPKAIKIASAGHHGTPITDGWLLVRKES